MFLSAGLLAGSVSAVVAYALIYVSAALLGFDDDILAVSEETPHEMAISAAMVGGCMGVVLGALLILEKRFWSGVLFALLYTIAPTMILVLAGRFGDATILALFAITIGLISRLAANFAVQRWR